jgi:hypothetical protein
MMSPYIPQCALTALLFWGGFAALAAAPAKAPPPKPWLEMDYGPTLSASIESAYPNRNITQKGIAIRLDAKSQTYVLFDEDLLRYSLAWTGGFIDFKSVLYDGTHRVWPSVVGQPIFGSSVGPGWGHGGSFDDPRTRYPSTDYTKESKDWQNRPYGPLSHDHAQYTGLYLHGQQVILAYTVDGTPVLDSPGLERAGAIPLITRTLNIARSSADLDLEVLEHPVKTAGILATFHPPGRARRATAEGSVAVLGDLARPPTQATTSPSTGAIAVVARGATNQMVFSIAGESQLRLHIPASATPAKIKLLIARVDAGSLQTFTAAATASPAPADLSSLLHGGPPRYPQELATTGVIGKDAGAFRADTLTAPDANPYKSRMRFGGFDFFPDGHSAAICTWDGDVWLVSGIDDKLDHLTWRRIATGLFQPLGLKILTNPQSAIGNRQSVIYVLCRDQLARLHDLNGDGEIDFIECVNNDAFVTEHFHEFAMGLQTDAQGNFYYAKSARHALDAVTPHHGTILRISKDGQRTDVLATGFRAANGVALGPAGEIVVTDQEGFWTPANRINLFVPSATSERPPFFGNIWGYTAPKRTPKEGYDPPLCWIPVNVDRSPAEDVWVTSERWGPLKGQLLHTSYGTGKVFLVLHETVDGVPQGGVVPIPGIAFPTGVMRARFNPADAQLYCCGLVGWATNCTQAGGFYRIAYTGQPVHLPTALHVQKDAIAISFSDALDKASAEDAASYAIQQWNYRWTQNYGSKHYRVSDPKKEGQDDVELSAVTLSDDQRTVTLHIPNLGPVMQMQIQVNLKSADGVAIKHTIHNTINRLPGTQQNRETRQGHRG